MMSRNNGLGFSRAAEAELSKRRSAARRLEMEHRENVRKNYPEIFALANEMNDIGVEFADKIIASPQDAEALEAFARGLVAQKKREVQAALVKNGLGADYLEPLYSCPMCRDTGKAGDELCACIKQVIIENMFSGSGLNRNETFETFRHDLIADPKQSRAMERIFEFCRGYAESFPENKPHDMLLIGPPGVGKSFLLNCIGGSVLNSGHSVLKLTANRLVSSVLDSIRDPEIERPDFIFPELLMIDDLGTEPMINNITLETLLSVLCERQDGGKSTIIATNKSIEDLAEEYGERIVSRMISPRQVKVIKITTPSIRVMRF